MPIYGRTLSGCQTFSLNVRRFICPVATERFKLVVAGFKSLSSLPILNGSDDWGDRKKKRPSGSGPSASAMGIQAATLREMHWLWRGQFFSSRVLCFFGWP